MPELTKAVSCNKKIFTSINKLISQDKSGSYLNAIRNQHTAGTACLINSLLIKSSLGAGIQITKQLLVQTCMFVSKILVFNNRPSDRVQKKIKNYAGIFRYIMWKNMLIMQKTRWIMLKFKQFTTLVIVPFRCFTVM